jgi:glycosyltransferase involved in cell wall biosynthesis
MKKNLISWGYDADKIEVIPYFTEIPKDFKKVNGKNNILFVGRISPEKGLDIFIDILRYLQEDFRFIIVGEGIPNYIDFLLKKIEEINLKNKVEFAGWVDNKNLNRYYEDAAFLVIPSIWPEPFGIVGIEAMAHGLPVIAFGVGGIPEWLEDKKTGFLIERGNIRDFAGKTDILLKDKSLRSEFGQNAYKRASTFYNKTNHISKLIYIFNQVVNSEN